MGWAGLQVDSPADWLWPARLCVCVQVEVTVLSDDDSTPLDAFYGYPGPFGMALNDTATEQYPVAVADPVNACGKVAQAPTPGAAAVVARGNCSFADKAWALQRAGYGAMLLFNNEEGAHGSGAGQGGRVEGAGPACGRHAPVARRRGHPAVHTSQLQQCSKPGLLAFPPPALQSVCSCRPTAPRRRA